VTRDEEIRVVREAAGLTRMNHVACIRCTGDEALTVLARLSTRRLFLREGQMSHTLFLRDDGLPMADVYVANAEDGGLYVLAEGPTEAELLDLVNGAAREVVPGGDFACEGLARDFELLGINGPYAWEVVGSVCGPAALGMPYLSVLHFEGGMCFRGGKTGEYGYDLLISREALSGFEASLRTEGEPLGLTPVGVSALDQCALENWHFNIRTLKETPYATPLTPLELQLQWRVSYRERFVGSDAVRERLKRGIDVRATSFASATRVGSGDPVWYREHQVGEVLAAGWSPVFDKWVGVALIATRLAAPGIQAFRVGTEGAGDPLSTLTPPLINNRSLHIDPHRHSFRTRRDDVFPPLVAAP
jgi:glycine cleavage system aminomethyltransferase T